MKILFLIGFFILLVACSTPEIVPDKEYQKQSAEKSNQQLDREVGKLK
jgi:hypothetical protein